MEQNFVLIGKPYNPDLKNIKADEMKKLFAEDKLNTIEFKKAKQNFAFVGIGAILYGAIVVLSRRS